MSTVSASSLGALLNSKDFVPYVYGRASGRPARGRPEKVLANPDLPETAVRLLAAGSLIAAAADKPLCGKPVGAYGGNAPTTCARPPHETGRCRSAMSTANRDAARRAREAARADGEAAS